MADIGLIGLGTMGSALALNIAEKGTPVAVHNRSPEVTRAFLDEAGPLAERLTGAETIEELVTALTAPRAIIIMVKAGGPVDSVIESLLPHLDPGDMIIDAGNADFHDTRRREADLAAQGFAFIGMGVSGGEDGARHGPSIMVGGPADSYERIREVIEGIAARYQGDPCAAHLGPDGAGHFVKTVHNGIEYAEMQLIAEVYGLLSDGQGRAPAEIGALFGEWNDGPLRSFLVEITAEVLAATDPVTGAPMVDVIVDSAGQKGTGRWTLIEALKLGQSATTIEAAVAARSWSAGRAARAAGQAEFGGDGPDCHPILDADLEQALIAARIIVTGQGMAILSAASEEFGWDLDLARVAQIWRAGCIIRSAMLDDISHAMGDGPPEGLLILSPVFTERLHETVPALRRVVATAVQGGLPVPALASALGYFDAMRQARGSAALIQAQRDFFGAHGFERVDAEGAHHGPWGG